MPAHEPPTERFRQLVGVARMPEKPEPFRKASLSIIGPADLLKKKRAPKPIALISL
jgi:hypothetical protein